MATYECLFCGTKVNVLEDFERDINFFQCNICGNYKITHEAYNNIYLQQIPNLHHIYSGILREKTELKLPVALLKTDNLINFIYKLNYNITYINKILVEFLYLLSSNNKEYS